MRGRDYVKRHMILAGLCAVILPLTILLGLQYQALAKLQETSPMATRASLESRLGAVANHVEAGYLVEARRRLDVPPSAIVKGSTDDDISVFQGAPAEGVRRYFIASLYSDTKKGKVTMYDPVIGGLSDNEARTPIFWAAFAASLYSLNQMMKPDFVVDPDRIEVDEKDPEHRIALKPIVDANSRMVGVAGMVVEPCYFTQTYLPRAVDEAMRKHFSESELAELGIVALDETGHTTWSSVAAPRATPQITVPLSFTFSRWRLGLVANGPSHETLAQRYFLVNISITVVMMLLLAAAVVLSLRAAAREMRLSQMKTDFVSNVSHELRTPLASIRVFGELMRLGRVDDPERIHQYGQLIETESRRLTQLVNNILDFSKIESGCKEYTFEEVSVERLVDEAIAAFTHQANQMGFAIEVDRTSEPLPHVFADGAAVSQAVLNLLDNAVKYSGDSRRVGVRLGRTGSTLSVSVVDYGIGIPPEELGRIFRRFHRVSSSLVHDVKGSGLGLALVKHVVEAHGGRVTVSSRLGQGSTFTITLPIARPEPQAQTSSDVEEMGAATVRGAR